MEGIHVYIKEEQPWEETYAEQDGRNPVIGSPSLEIESKAIVSSQLEGPLVKNEPDLPSNFQDSSEFHLGKGSNFNIKEEAIEDFIKEEVDIPQFSFDEAASSSGSVRPAHFKTNSKIGTEKAEEKTVEPNCLNQPIKFRRQNTKGAERSSLPPDDIYGNLAYQLLLEPKKSLTDKPFENSKLDDSINDSRFPCPICNKLLSSKICLNNHLQIHSGEFAFICQYCGKGFNCRANVNKHIQIHTGEKAFRCSECGSRFNDKSILKRHLLIHTGEKPHQCLICNKSFSISSHLIDHNNSVHLKIKSFKCSFCDKSFSRNSNLKQHERIHTGEKPYECDICLARFTRITCVKRHQLIHK